MREPDEIAPPAAPPSDELDSRLCAIVLDQTEEGVLVVDAAGRITFANASARRLYGVPHHTGDFTGDAPGAHEILTPDGSPYPVEDLPLARALRGETVRDVTWRIRRADGSETVVQGTAVPLTGTGGILTGATLTLRDTTALYESEAHYRHAIELNPQVSWTADPDGGITDFNQRWLNLTGLTREQALGGGWAQVPHPDDLPRMVAAWTHAVQTGVTYDVEHRIRVADGSYHWMRSRASARRDAAGNIIRWYGTTEDIEARKQAEQAREVMATRQRTFVREVLASMTEGRLHLVEDAADLPAPLASEPVAPPVPLTRETLRLLRRQVRHASAVALLPAERENDVETAVGEIAMNAVVHAGGGEGRAYADATRGAVQIWITDSGLGIREETLHRATLEKGFSTAGTLGFGYWLVLRSADRIYLLTGDAGTTVVVEQERETPPPRWFSEAPRLSVKG